MCRSFDKVLSSNPSIDDYSKPVEAVEQADLEIIGRYISVLLLLAGKYNNTMVVNALMRMMQGACAAH